MHENVRNLESRALRLYAHSVSDVSSTVIRCCGEGVRSLTVERGGGGSKPDKPILARHRDLATYSLW